ncbi:hypothetical protein EVAR_36513_1 [Eumeta japonica]|uniref:Uncharacterized protein n=1 Tax=Eumeta variegata TaxID=151549 RepID=A0A4C1X7G5_EUMVA|nr:hypothetical protein EVAR_36513_1 [Eumeta japonica]
MRFNHLKSISDYSFSCTSFIADQEVNELASYHTADVHHCNGHSQPHRSHQYDDVAGLLSRNKISARNEWANEGGKRVMDGRVSLVTVADGDTSYALNSNTCPALGFDTSAVFNFYPASTLASATCSVSVATGRANDLYKAKKMLMSK